jgi:hypothetical protein
MPVQSAAVKAAKTARGRRVLQKREPKLIENARNTLIARGQKTSALVNAALTDLYMLKKPHSVHFKRHNAVHPFEDAAPLDDDATQTPSATSLASQWRSALELGSPWYALRHLFRLRLQSRAIIHHN